MSHVIVSPLLSPATRQILQEYGCRLESIRNAFPLARDVAVGPEGVGATENALPVFELNIALQDLQK